METLLAAQELMDIYSPGQNHTSGKGGRCLSGQVCLLPAPAGQHLNVGALSQRTGGADLHSTTLRWAGHVGPGFTGALWAPGYPRH